MYTVSWFVLHYRLLWVFYHLCMCTWYSLLLLSCFCFPFIHKLKHPYMTRVRYPILGMPNVILLNHINIQICSNHRKGNDCRHKSMIKLRFPIHIYHNWIMLSHLLKYMNLSLIGLKAIWWYTLLFFTTAKHCNWKRFKWKLEIEAILLAKAIYLPHA